MHRTRPALLAFGLTLNATFVACAIAQDAREQSTPNVGESKSAIALGEAVADINNSCWVIFQDQDDNYWFGSDGQGVCRYDGKAGGTVMRFTTKDGLAHDQIRGIDQHKATGDILITTNGGVTRFNGQRFVTLPMVEMKPPPLPLTADGLKQAGWTLNDTDTWLRGSGGPRRYDGRTLYQLKFPANPLESEWRAKQGDVQWNPYDVWTVYADRRGHKWFGTGGMGVCRFDGRSLDWMYEDHLTEVGGGGWFGFRSIVEDDDGTFWICNTQYGFDMQPHGVTGQDSGLIKYQRKDGMDWSAVDTTDKFIYFQSVTKDDNGDLWMTPWAGGVWRHDGAKGTHYPMKVGDEHIKMIAIYKDNRGDIWVATQEHGPFRFNGNAFERFKP